ncbi:MAG: polysaccharide deacetylase family protein, partial [Puia sp.]
MSKINIRFTWFLRIIILFFISNDASAQQMDSFRWPDGKQVAISLTFDDARMSQVDSGISLLDHYGVKATFYVVPSRVKLRLEGWRKAVLNKHEIGNHSLVHPCTGNFAWSRGSALEDYSLK